VTRVYPGIKENAAIFSHPNAWPIIAEAVLGRGDQAVAFYDSILPYHQNDNIDVRGAEPYAYVQFIYGRDHEWFGRAQNPWLTGTAGWMYTAVTKWILGVRLTLDGLVVDLPTAFYLVAAEIDEGVIVGQLPATEGGTTDQFGILMASNSPLTQCTTQAVDQLRADGTLDTLEQTWLGSDAGAPVLQ
jgi:hypothetical protein